MAEQGEKVFVKKVETTDERFSNKAISITGGDTHNLIPVPDNVVVCDGCNKNLYPDPGYLVFFGMESVEKDQPYDVYCESCLKNYFKEYEEIPES